MADKKKSESAKTVPDIPVAKAKRKVVTATPKAEPVKAPAPPAKVNGHPVLDIIDGYVKSCGDGKTLGLGQAREMRRLVAEALNA